MTGGASCACGQRQPMGPGKALMFESNNEVMMGDLHAFLAIVRAAPLFCFPKEKCSGRLWTFAFPLLHFSHQK